MCASQMATIKLNWNTQTLQLGFNVSCLIPTLHWLLSRLWNLNYRVKKIPGIYGINFILEQCWDICLFIPHAIFLRSDGDRNGETFISQCHMTPFPSYHSCCLLY